MISSPSLASTSDDRPRARRPTAAMCLRPFHRPTTTRAMKAPNPSKEKVVGERVHGLMSGSVSPPPVSVEMTW